jgi:hypothetical protein
MPAGDWGLAGLLKELGRDRTPALKSAQEEIVGVIQLYRRVSVLAAIAAAASCAVVAALGGGAAAAYLTSFLLEKFGGPQDIGGGILVILIGLNTAVPLFISVFTILVSCHHRTSWRTPTAGFALCIVAVRMMGAFDIQFAPFMLGTGALAWILSCWLLRNKKSKGPAQEHVV